MERSMKRNADLMTKLALATLGVSVMSSITSAAEDSSRFTYGRLQCTPDNESHFTDVTVELSKENFLPCP